MTKYISLLLFVIAASLSTGCASVYKLDQYDGFGDWFIGRPGLRNTLKAPIDARTHKVADMLLHTPYLAGKRCPIYLHLRFPELIFQPKGALWYPERMVVGKPGVRNDALYMFKKATTSNEDLRVKNPQDYNYNQLYYAVGRESGEYKNSFSFDLTDGGLIEIIPYRVYTSDAKGGDKALRTVLQPFAWCLQVVYGVVCRAPVYIVHDVTKTLMIPVAAVYYLSRD